ncbi:uncharacterized protein PSFLO_00243 [Pseudozyma flocculosa]|uniref:Uncharacterized protein n=1 Tax=Pseudozyma flocculosa TaxID=84751 RepID=A0A5C3ERP0_9BASI|nr:uncharacterized protein PSFLO_00243 [Pseudozyma flocculosa]
MSKCVRPRLSLSEATTLRARDLLGPSDLAKRGLMDHTVCIAALDPRNQEFLDSALEACTERGLVADRSQPNIVKTKERGQAERPVLRRRQRFQRAELPHLASRGAASSSFAPTMGREIPASPTGRLGCSPGGCRRPSGWPWDGPSDPSSVAAVQPCPYVTDETASRAVQHRTYVTHGPTGSALGATAPVLGRGRDERFTGQSDSLAEGEPRQVGEGCAAKANDSLLCSGPGALRVVWVLVGRAVEVAPDLTGDPLLCAFCCWDTASSEVARGRVVLDDRSCVLAEQGAASCPVIDPKPVSLASSKSSKSPMRTDPDSVRDGRHLEASLRTRGTGLGPPAPSYGTWL